MNFLLTILTMALAFPVMLVAGCRLLHLVIGVHRLIWIVLYLSAVFGAIACMGEASHGRATWPQILLLVFVAASLWVSRVTWRKGPPLFVER